MKTTQINKLAMYRAVQALLQVAPETSGIAALPARVTEFVTQIAMIDELDRAQNLPLRGKVDDRDALLEELIGQTLELAGFATSHARAHGLHDLAARVSVSSRDFHRLRITRRTGLAQQVHDAIQPIVAQLAAYGVMPETLAAYQAAIDVATNAVSEPRATVVVKRAATEAMVQAFVETDDLLETHIDPLLFPLRKTQPEFYAEYRARREVTARTGSTAETRAARAALAAPGASPASIPLAA